MKPKLNLLLLIIFNLIIFNLQSSKAQMFWNHAASFQGNNSSYIKCRNSPSLNLTGSFTLEAWINPSTLGGFSKGIIAKGGTLGTSLIYGMRLESTGRIALATNGVIRLKTKVSTVVPVNQWTHIAGTYNSLTGAFKLYFNGALDSTSVIFAPPASNTDTLFFGISGTTTPFSGMMDEVRIWNRELGSFEAIYFMRTSISAFGGLYDGLVMSLPFQMPYSNVPQFTVFDWSAFFNTCINMNVNDVDLSDLPSKTICINQSVTLGGLDDYVAGADNIYISPSTSVTLQAWIFPRSNADAVIIHKGTPNGSTTNYSLNIINKKLAAKINGIVFDSQDTIPPGEWTHVSFAYFLNGIGSVFTYRFWINGKFVKSGNLTATNITDGTDSLYIGGSIGLPDFNGLIDEVRISRYSKSLSDINDSLFIPMEVNPAQVMTTVAYNFDGWSRCNTTLGPNLHFRNDAFMNALASPISPLDRAYSLNFQKAFYLKHSGRRIPESGGVGISSDSLDIFLDENISDINVYVALDHQNSSNLEIDLIAPDGSSLRIFDNNELIAYNESVVTVFDDNAPTSMSNFTFTSFSPKIQPVNNLNSIFSGKNTKGVWKLKINDIQNSDSGRLYVWGIQFNNRTVLPKILSCKSFIQGFYNPASNTMIPDTMRCYLRSFPFPYPIIDSAKAYLQSDGSASFVFISPAVTNFNNYYFQLKHRNSIETWNKNLMVFPSLLSQLTYDFTTDSAKAFGNNQKRVDNSPVEYAFYSGDVNQDGLVDGSDGVLIDNAATNFVTGYVVTDITGDYIVDGSDAAIADNNAANFVSVIRP